MSKLPTHEENPRGLHQKYIVQKANGDEVDPQATYFVLRLDNDGDRYLNKASRRAALLYAGLVEKHYPRLASDLREKVEEIEQVERESRDVEINLEVPEVGSVYRHFKGRSYIVIGTAIDTDTGDLRIQYTAAVGDDRRVWSRLHSEFFEDIPGEGSRFQYAGPATWDKADRILPSNEVNEYQLGFSLRVQFVDLKTKEDLFKFLEEFDEFLADNGLVDEFGQGGKQKWFARIAHRGGNRLDTSEQQRKKVVEWCERHLNVLTVDASELKNMWKEDKEENE